jgi:DNA invertase Pin-like site-specific DNA recombinase
MIGKIEDQHRQKAAYIYLRQSTMAQVRHHQESTERQYALKEKAVELGWTPGMIRTLDGDLGISGAQMTGREDFKTLMADICMGKVGAVFALEASRLGRSCADWYRLMEFCALTNTLIIDEDGCYNTGNFNDRLLLGLKATMSQAELHFMSLRLQGGKLNKAKKGELRFPLPVGYCYDPEGRTVVDPDQQVQGAVRLLFATFRQTGSAYGVVHRFAQKAIQFPKRSYGGIWNGRLIWGRLTEGRVLTILKNPAYAGVYAFGRFRCRKQISSEGQVQSKITSVPMVSWTVTIPDHHERYITWEEFLENQTTLLHNLTHAEENILTGPAREGLALLQGVLLCGNCGRRLTVRYKGNGGIYPTYECNWLRREGLATRSCLHVRCSILDDAVSERLLQVLHPAQLQIALEALHELERRDEALSHQWRMRIERAEYEAQLAQRRYEEVDPANRLVAATLECRWNDALNQLQETQKKFDDFLATQARATTPQQQEEILSLAQDFPRLWNAPTTRAKDRKRMVRLLVKDITINKGLQPKQLLTQIRWQGGASETLVLDLPPSIADQLRYPDQVVARVQELAAELPDDQIAATLNRENCQSSKGKMFNVSMIRWIRYRHKIPAAALKRSQELTVAQMAQHFGVSIHVVYYWIERGLVETRRLNGGSPYWITISVEKEQDLLEWVRRSSRIRNDNRADSEAVL